MTANAHNNCVIMHGLDGLTVHFNGVHQWAYQRTQDVSKAMHGLRMHVNNVRCNARAYPGSTGHYSLQFNLTQHCDKLKADEHACYTVLYDTVLLCYAGLASTPNWLLDANSILLYTA